MWIVDFLTRLFETKGFTPKAHSGPSWTSTLVLFSTVIHTIIAFGFFTIPIALYQIKKKYIDDRTLPIYNILSFFCILFGFSRLGIILEFYWPAYRLFMVLSSLCAVTILVFGWRLASSLETLLLVPSIEQVTILNKELETRRKAQKLLEEQSQLFLHTIHRLQTVLETNMWLYDKDQALKELKEAVNDLHNRTTNQ